MPRLLRKTLPIALACTLAVTVAGCGGGGGKPTDVPADAIAVVGKDTIKKSELQDLFARARATYKLQKRPFPKPGTRDYANLKDELVRFLVQESEYRQEAASIGVKVSDGDVEKRLKGIEKSGYGGDEKKFEAALRQQGLTLAQARGLIRDRLIQEGIYKKITGNVKVSQSEIEAYYKQQKAQFSEPDTRSVRHILVKTKAKADAIYSQLQQGASFAALARKDSVDTGTARVGGKYTARKGQDDPAFDRVAFSLKNGQIAKPVKSQFGWHIIQALGPVKKGTVTPLSKVEGAIRGQLLTQKRSSVIQHWNAQFNERWNRRVTYAPGYKLPPAPTTAAP
jgi:parvulin-like peptidyl-prolyl isomerase